MHNSRHAFARRRRAPIDGTITRYFIEADGTRRKREAGTTHVHKPLSHSDLMREAGARGLGSGTLAVSASGWDQDN